MSLRILLLSTIVAVLSVYAWRNWFRALCGAVVLMAFLEHGDMPKSMLGLQGLNLWNLLMVSVVGAWLQQRRLEGLEWDVPKNVRIAFFLYCGIIVWAFLRFLLEPTIYYPYRWNVIVVDYLINPLKFLIPGLLFYDGCRTRERVVWALASIVLLYFLLSIQVIRYMGIHLEISGAALARRSAKVIQGSVGYNRVDMSMMLAGASWAMIAFSQLVKPKLWRMALWCTAPFIVFAQAMTGGRTGYIAWAGTGLVLCVIRWRKLLPLIPVAVAVVLLLVPSVRERMLFGFGVASGPYVAETDTSEITSGRNVMWPYVIEKIKEAPLFGYGRHAMVRTGLANWLLEELGEIFAHPHNAYLEMLLDNGIIGLICVLPLYVIILRKGVSLFHDRQDVLFAAAGGVSLALVLALLVAGTGAQTLYPREGVLGMWAAIGVAVRVWVERERFYTEGQYLLGEESVPGEAPIPTPQSRAATFV